ncbi:MAG: hypothetical protein JRG91_18010 [Deltaproteobacteria bacterium]|nr:hypothetical protein [Deltaproteobacteria bacterium]
MKHALPSVFLSTLLFASCGSSTGVQGDATAEPDVEVGDAVALTGFMFTTRNLMDITVYIQLQPRLLDELPMQRDLGAGWEDITVWRPVDDIECPDSPDECVCPTPTEPWQMRQLLPDDEYQVGWAPSPSPSSDCYILVDDFCADCRCYRPTSIYPGRYSVTRCVYNDYRCTESDPCGPESVGYFRPAEPAGDQICVRREFDIPGATSDIQLPIDP